MAAPTSFAAPADATGSTGGGDAADDASAERSPEPEPPATRTDEP
jgi:hypothetical protein